MATDKSARRLGRGLDALFNTAPEPVDESAGENTFREIQINEVGSNPFQPRKQFAIAELRELEESLRSSGLLQPITVRPAPDGGKGYQLVAGERRLRAATGIGWKKIQAVVRELSDQQMLTLALVENLQRTDLNPIEEAEGYSQLIREFSATQQSVAGIVGKDRSTVANALRLLQLPEAVRQLLQSNGLSAGHARPLLALNDEAKIIALANEVIAKGMSARDVERRVRETGSISKRSRGNRLRKVDVRPAEIRQVEDGLRKYLQTDVSVMLKDLSRGSITIEFYSPEDLDRVVELIGIPTDLS